MAEDEIILFQRPENINQVLFVWGLPEQPLSWEEKWRQLEEAFKIYGLLYAVHVPENTCYAFIKYYSPKSAKKALVNTDRKLFIGKSLLKVYCWNIILLKILVK